MVQLLELITAFGLLVSWSYCVYIAGKAHFVDYALDDLREWWNERKQ